MTEDTNETYTFAIASFLNAAPLAAFLEDVDPRVRVFSEPPSQLMAHVLSGRADAAMVPVFDFFNTPGVKMIDSISITSLGNVRSVWLKCHKPLDQIRSVTPDPASRSSNALARILLKKHFGLNVPMQAPEPGESPDATIVIGDRALQEPPGEFGNYDLAGIWTEMTSLPFVFAVWAYRDDNPKADELSRIALEAKTAGLANLEQLADRYVDQLPLSREECLEYISELLTYELGPKEIEGMELFCTLIAELDADGDLAK